MSGHKHLALLVLGTLALICLVKGHGGGLHDWSFLPVPTPGKEFIRHHVASCSSWTTIDPSLGLLGPLPMFPPSASKLTATGSASIFYYLDGNCTDRATTSIDINVNLTLNGQPYAFKQVNGYGFIGNCSNPTDLYRHNSSLGDNRFNLVWFRKENSNTSEDGQLWGAGPNVMISRVPPATDAVRSIVLFPSPADSNPLCCDLVYNPPPPADFLTQGSFCRVPAPPPPQSQSPPSPPPSPKPPSSRPPSPKPPSSRPPSPKPPSSRPPSPKPLSPRPPSPKPLSPRPPSPKPPSPRPPSPKLHSPSPSPSPRPSPHPSPRPSPRGK